MVVPVARQYHRHRLNFCIITFYDPQRAAIIKALEDEDLPSDCVYNVDSFQGMWRSHCFSVDDLLRPSSLIPSSFNLIRERGRLCDPVFRSDKAAGFFEIATPHERRSDPLPQGNDSRRRQELFTGQGEEDAPREAQQHLVKAPRRLLE